MSTKINISVVAKDQATKQLRSIGRQIEGFAKAASSAFIGIGAAVSGAAAGLLRIVTGAASAADDLNTLSIQTGLSVEQLQELSIVAEQSGTKTDALARGVMTLIGSLEQAKDPSSAIAGALNELGINIVDVNGNLKPMGELFPQIIDSLRGIEDPTNRAALANSIFGRALALELLPILALTDEEYQGIIDRAYELGRIMGKEQVDELNKASNSWKEMKGIMESARNHIATALLPIFERMNQLFLEKGVPALAQLREKIEGLVNWYMNLDEGTKNLIDKVVLFLAALLPVGLAMKGIIAVIKPLIIIIKPLLAAIGAIVTALGFKLIAIAAVIAAGVYLYKNWEQIKEKAVEIWGKITSWIEEKLEFIRNLFINLAAHAIVWGRDMFQGFLDGITGMFGRIRDTVSNFVSGIGDTIKGVLGIRSPSRVYAEIGKNMGLGLELGLERSLGQINVDKMMPALATPHNTSNSYSFNPTINTGGTNLTQNDFIRLLDTYWRKASRERGL